MNRLKSAIAPGVAAVVLLGCAAPALAHGDISSSSPEPGATLKRSPNSVRLVLAEPPAAGSDLDVRDGCGERVSGEPRRDGSNLSTSLARGQPGRWRVRLRSISSVDGHVISKRFSFRVAGKRDCSADEQDPGEAGPDEETSSRPPITNPDDTGPGFPLIPFGLGTLAVVAVALALRRSGDKG